MCLYMAVCRVCVCGVQTEERREERERGRERTKGRGRRGEEEGEVFALL